VKRLLASAALVAVFVSLASTASAVASGTSQQRKTCQVFRVVEEDSSAVFHSLLLRLRMQVSWCYDGKTVKVSVTCKVEKFDRMTITIDSCQAQGNPVAWRGKENGAYYAQVSVNYSNCVLKFGCWASAQMEFERWMYADGSINKTPRGEVRNDV